MTVNNSPEKIRLRKYQDTLWIVGRGFILFGLWSAVKSLAAVFLERGRIISQIRETDKDIAAFSDGQILTVFIVITAAILLVDLSLRLYIGRSAIAEGKGTKTGVLYIPLTAVFVIVGFANAVYMTCIIVSGRAPSDPDNGVSYAAVIIEITQVIMMIEMIRAAIKVKNNKKHELLKEADDAA